MKEKEQYTFDELYDNLKITVSEFCRRAEITEGTLSRIRKGYPTRRSTANKLLDAFSQVYNLEFSLENVEGINLEERVTKTRTIPTSAALTYEPERIAKRSEDIPENAPEGTMKLIDFSVASGIPASTLGRWGRTGKIEVITVPRISGHGSQSFIIPDQQQKAKELDQARKSENPAA